MISANPNNMEDAQIVADFCCCYFWQVTNSRIFVLTKIPVTESILAVDTTVHWQSSVWVLQYWLINGCWENISYFILLSKTRQFVYILTYTCDRPWSILQISCTFTSVELLNFTWAYASGILQVRIRLRYFSLYSTALKATSLVLVF